MERQLNCFEWQVRSSDFLDGTLPDSEKREAEDHIDTCKECHERYKRYRVILSSIASQPRTPLPSAIKKSPLKAVVALGEAKLSLSRWERLPWYFRTLVEGVGIVIVITIGIASAPKIRQIYEKSIEQSLTDFKESFHVSEPIVETADPTIPSVQGKHLSPMETAEEDEISGEDDSDQKSVHVGRSELWRFTLKTVSPDELRPQVVKALNELKVPMNTPGIGGIKVPGGIEFDLVLPQSIVADIKHTLQKLTPASHEDTKSNLSSFSWYRVKSKRKLPEGKSQVVIWLAQPH